MSDTNTSEVPRKGAIAWTAKHPVISNLMMAGLIVGGALMARSIKMEVFPEFQLDVVTISVAYPATSPSEVERGIVTAIEESIDGTDGVKKITSTAVEGSASIVVELLDGVNPNKALSDIKNAVDRIRSMPNEAEDPIVSLASTRRQVISLVLHGDRSEHELRAMAEHIREELLDREEISQVELSGVRRPEIGVEVDRETLRRYGLTLQQIAREVSNTAVELSGGGVKTPGGEVLVRTDERREYGDEFSDVPVVVSQAGSRLELGDVARRIDDGFEDVDQSSTFNGRPAVVIDIYRTGDETPIGVADAVKEYAEKLAVDLPPGVEVSIWRDQSRVLRERIDLLLRNAWAGLLLVLVVLGLFLELRLAFWVTMGIPISFFGSMLLAPLFGVSINMITLFAFIVTLGMVVDDAIVVGENVYFLRKQGKGPMEAAIQAAREVAAPVCFAILTSIAAFSPMFFVPGFMGKIFFSIPAIVVSVLLLSLFESLFILPAHLGHLRDKKARGVRAFIVRLQGGFANGLEWLIEKTYRPVVSFAVSFRYTTAAVAVALLAVTIGFVAGGFIRFEFMPKIDSDTVAVSVKLPYGVAVKDTEAIRARLVTAAEETLEALGGAEKSEGIYATVGSLPTGGGPGGGAVSAGGGSHLAGVTVQLVPTDQRSFSAAEFVEEWRRRAGKLPNVETAAFTSSLGGPSAGSPIDVQLAHRDVATLEAAARELAQRIGRYPGMTDMDPGFSPGKPQLNLELRPEARAKGITVADLGNQVRSALYGTEALRQQRGRDEVRVLIRLPDEERESEYDIENLIIRTPSGGEMLLSDAAFIDRGRAYTEIRRADGSRVLNVTADIVAGKANAAEVMGKLQNSDLPELMAKYPGLSWSVEGEQKEQKESLQALGVGFLIGLLVIYGLLAIPFRSWTQPLIVMSAIPFGIVGAVGGHLLLGFNLSVISIMGIVALAGIVVNDSLVLIDAINGFRAEGQDVKQAVIDGGVRRFRPILLTSLTTFFGLAPMMFETSLQARFLIPMAVSLGFGVLFATFVILLLVPASYMILEDIHNFWGDEAEDETPAAPPLKQPA